MSGDSRDEDSPEWQWAHIMWQRHGMRFDEWAEMDPKERLVYIASDKLEEESPVTSAGQIKKGLLKKRK